MTEKHTKAEEQMADLPEKLANTGEFRNADDKYVIMLNGYNLRLDKVVDVVYRHELKFQGFLPSRTLQSGKVLPEKYRDLWKGEKNDVANRLRARLNYTLFNKLVEQNRDLFASWNPNYKKSPMHGYAYDCSTILFSLVPIVQKGETKTFTIEKNAVDGVLYAYLNSPFLENFKAEISGCDEVNVKKIDAVTETRDRSAIQFLEVLFNQYIYFKDTYYVFPEKMFLKEAAKEIRLQEDPRVLKAGFAKNVRLVGDCSTDCHAVVHVDAKKAAFYPAVDVVDFVYDLLKTQEDRREYNFVERLRSGNARETVHKFFRGISFETTHGKSSRVFVFGGLSDKPARDLEFECKNGITTVQKYFSQAYSFELKYPDLPCFIEQLNRKDKNNKYMESYYPMEILRICEGQRVSFDKQTPKLVEQMIRNCQAKPIDFKRNIEEQKGAAFLSNDNPYGKAFGVGVSHEIERANATVLHAPKVVYNNQNSFEIQNKDAGWKQPNRSHFLIPADVGTWVIAEYSRCLDDQTLDNFTKLFVALGQEHGMNIGQPAHFQRITHGSEKELRSIFKTCADNNVNFFMCVTKNRLDPIHNLLKLMEIEFNITTQHVWSTNVSKAVHERHRRMTPINIIMKTNLKLGGVNYGLYTSQSFSNANRISHDIVDKEWLRESRMFIGIDFSHAAPQSRFERNKGVPVSDPTVVGMAYTLGLPLKMRGDYWYQEPRVTHVQKLDEHIVEAVVNYWEQAKRWPQHIIVYRTGASEGEYRIAVTYEQAAFERAFAILHEQHKMDKKPFLTMVVVQKNSSNYRIVPQEPRGDKPFLQNVPSGTCVDQGIMNPCHTEFLLVGHKTIQGTARPARCTVIFDDHKPRVKLQELEYVTYNLCFAHGIVCSPVSVPAPLYSASDLAKRGRNNYKASKDYKNEKGLYMFERRNEEDDTFFDRMSEELKNALCTKYWA